LTTCDRPDNQEGLRTGCDCLREWSIRGFVGPILLTRKEPHEGPALFCNVITDRSTQHGIMGLERVEHRPLGDRSRHFKLHLGTDASQRLQMIGKRDTNHGSVCTSTETPAGRSRTMGAQRSPASGETYTWPPVVPK